MTGRPRIAAPTRRVLALSKLLFGLVGASVVLTLSGFEAPALGMRGAAVLVGLVLVVEVERLVRRALRKHAAQERES